MLKEKTYHIVVESNFHSLMTIQAESEEQAKGLAEQAILNLDPEEQADVVCAWQENAQIKLIEPRSQETEKI